MSFDSFGLSDRLMQGISAAEYTTPTPIQQAAIPRILEGADLIGCAQTGTGKTAATWPGVAGAVTAWLIAMM